MKKMDLIKKMAEKSGLSESDASKALNAYMEAIKEALEEGDSVRLAGFGTFEVRAREARKGKNPRTGEEITIAASKVPAFKAGKALKDTVNK